MKSIILFIYIISISIGLGQNIPTGSWRTHYSFNATISITQSNEYVFAAAESGIYRINKEDRSIISITKVNGLSETEITYINYNSTSNTLIIAYKNGQIDLLKENRVSSISDIRLSEILTPKVTHHMYDEEHFTYLSTDFGLVRIDTNLGIVQESFLNLDSMGGNTIVYATTIYNDSLFLATESGIIVGSLQQNLKDFSKWKRFNSEYGILKEPSFCIALFEGQPITGNTTQGLLVYENGLWKPLNILVGEKFLSIVQNKENVIITTLTGVFNLTATSTKKIQSPDIIYANTAIGDNGSYWVADNYNGVVHIRGISSETIYPNGPFFKTIKTLKFINNKIFALPKFRTENDLPAKNKDGFSVFEEGIWTNYNSTGYKKTILIPEFFDITGVSNFNSTETIFSSYGYGLLKWDKDIFKIIDESNSPLVNSLPPQKNVLITDINAFNASIWVLNNNNSSLLSFTKDETWLAFTPFTDISQADKIITTPWNDHWISTNPSVGGGIIVYNNDLNQEIILKSSNLESIPSNIINEIILDKENKIWIATNEGVVYYIFPENLLSNPNQKPIIPIIDSNLLFNNKKVNTLAVDGGNRIWMGTDNGAWLFDNDGTTLLNHFTTENSPILSNVVTNISINDKTGEVFFNTNKGLISYRGDATITATYSRPKIFPNPIRPGYTGVITIEGVPTNSILRITDSSGRLVSLIEANGNTAIWNMENEYSNQVISGIYFVFVVSRNGKETQIGKIAIIK